mmetsp:Transcript_46858/g.92518  ORF Transcript_46858/g.92518 Transcript_46858/m.92518 type:complete len:124 (-) Transcript_46858:1268-1639(-)
MQNNHANTDAGERKNHDKSMQTPRDVVCVFMCLCSATCMAANSKRKSDRNHGPSSLLTRSCCTLHGQKDGGFQGDYDVMYQNTKKQKETPLSDLHALVYCLSRVPFASLPSRRQKGSKDLCMR